MITSIFAALTSFFVSLLLLPIIISVSRKKNLFDSPGGRRIHKKVTPSLGGIAIFFGFVIGSIVWTESQDNKRLFEILCVIAIPFIIGFLDDLFHLKPLMKIISQALAATLIFFILDVRLTSFYGLFYGAAYPEFIGFFFTLFSVILITNSFNLIDGIDGLAATFALVVLMFLGTWFHFANDYHYSLLCFALSGGILAFLFMNWEPSKIFMGDTGSLIIGMMLSILSIEFLNINYSLPQNSEIKFESSVGTLIAILIIPLADTIRVVIVRLYKGVSPLTPDKRHVHHALIRLGNSHRFAVSILCLVHIFFISIAIGFRTYSNVFVISIVVFSAVFLCVILDRLILKHTFK